MAAPKEEGEKTDIKTVCLGDYDWKFLCMPRKFWEAGKVSKPPPFFAHDEPISIFVATIMGLQHALAMVGGIITVPLIIAGSSNANLSSKESGYLISAALIVSGIASLIQVTQLKIPGTRYVLGTGLLSVMGISFTFLPIAEASIAIMTKCACDGVPCKGSACTLCTGTLTGDCNTGGEAYGRFLGTLMVCAFLEIFLSFIPPKALKLIFPPVVTGVVVILIGANLLGTGFYYWGGGVFCGQNVYTFAPKCSDNGETNLPFGSPQYIGLGFVVYLTLVVVEFFGSPFMRNIQVIIGLFVGMVVASLSHVTSCSTPCASAVCEKACAAVLPVGLTFNNITGAVTGTATAVTYPNATNGQVCFNTTCAPPVCGAQECDQLKYVTGKQISSADWITFLWVHTFPIGFYAPAIIPCLIGFVVTTMECIGDVTATRETSMLSTEGEEFNTSVQGGVLADGINSFFSALATMMPVTTFAQNNGVIALTRCASRRAGIACACWLILLGIIAKFAAIILTIPDAVLGGMTTFLFVNVLISGIKILTMGNGLTRRSRFISAMSIAVGLGVTIVPQWVQLSDSKRYPTQGNLWPIKESYSQAMTGFRNALIIVLSTGFSIGGFIAILLNLVLPLGPDDVEADHSGWTEHDGKNYEEPAEVKTDAPKTQAMEA